MLTAAEIRRLKPGTKRYRRSAGGGLYLEVMPDGRMTWRVAYRVAGRQRVSTIGDYPDVTLPKARLRREAIRIDLEAGRDPEPAKRDAAPAEPRRQPGGWRVLCEEWLAKREREGLAAQTMRRNRGILRKTYAPLGGKDASEITPRDLLAACRAEEEAGSFHTAARLRAICSAVFQFGIARGECEIDPASMISKALTSAPVRKLSGVTEPRAVAALLDKVRGYTGAAVTRNSLLLLAHTFVRQGELRFATWGEIDLDGALWTIPAERMKMRRKHVVPLSRQVVAILREQAEVGRADLVLPSPVRAGRAISENTLNAALREIGYTRETHVPHGFRTTASTLLHEAGWPSDWIEAQLAHRDGSVRGVYNAAEYLPQRRVMMQAWSDWLAGGCEGSLAPSGAP